MVVVVGDFDLWAFCLVVWFSFVCLIWLHDVVLVIWVALVNWVAALACYFLWVAFCV